MNGPGDCVVQHSLSSDGKLSFSTPADGSVSITLNRTYDDTTGTLSVQVSGTRDGQSFSGSQVTPPLDFFPQTSADTKQAPFDLGRKTTKSAIPSRIESLLTWQDICTIVGTAFGIFSFAVALYQVYLWIREDREKRATRAQRVEQELEDKASLLEVVTEQRTNTLDVNWDSAWRTLTDDITSRINQELNDVDFNTQTPDQIVESLRQTASDAAVESLRNYVQHRIGSQILETLDPFRSLPSYQDIKNAITDETVSQQVRPKLRDIGSDPSTYDPLIRSLTLEARQRAFLDNYERLSEAYNGAESAYEDARKRREGTEQDIEDVDRAIEEAKEAGDAEAEAREEERKSELEEQLEQLREEEEEKERARDEAQEAKNEAADQSHDADNDVNEDHSREDWDHKGEGVFG